MDNTNLGVIIKGVDVQDILQFISDKNKKFIANHLSNLEDVLDPNTEEYKLVRKLFLDTQNNYTRSIVRTLLGDIEYNDYGD